MYYVYSHRYGPKASIGINGMLWQSDLPGHEWTEVSRHRKKAEAIAACDAFPFHARVHWTPVTSEFIHDNGRVPGHRVRDCRPDKTIPIRHPGSLEYYRLDAPDVPANPAKE